MYDGIIRQDESQHTEQYRLILLQARADRFFTGTVAGKLAISVVIRLVLTSGFIIRYPGGGDVTSNLTSEDVPSADLPVGRYYN